MAAAKYTFALTRAALTMNTEKPKRRDCKERPRWSVAYTHWTTSMIMVEIVVRDVTTEEVKMKSQIKSSPFFHFFFFVSLIFYFLSSFSNCGLFRRYGSCLLYILHLSRYTSLNSLSRLM